MGGRIFIFWHLALIVVYFWLQITATINDAMSPPPVLATYFTTHTVIIASGQQDGRPNHYCSLEQKQ